MPYTTLVAGTPITASWANLNVRNQVITPFATAAARTAAVTTPVVGMVTFLQDSETFWYYTGTAWRHLVGGAAPSYSARVYRAGAYSLPAAVTTTIFPFDTESYDNGANYVTGGSAAYTAPVTGLYTVAASIGWSVQNTPEETALDIYVTGAFNVQLDRIVSRAGLTAGDHIRLTGSTTVSVTAGQAINIRVFHMQGGNTQPVLTGTQYAWATFDKVN